MKAYDRDVFRTIRNEKKRFFSIMLITALGVTMLCGLRAACSDLRHTADAFYDGQHLYDISVVSTLGMTKEDVVALSGLEGVEAAEGSYNEVVHVKIGEQNKTAQVKTVSSVGINMPYLCEGRLPEYVDEIVVTQNFLEESGKQVGDTVVIFEELEEDEEASFPKTQFAIVGTIIDVTDVNGYGDAVAFRTSAVADYYFFVLPEAVESDIYTAVYLTLEGGDSVLCYSSMYDELVDEMMTKIDSQLKNERQQARYDAVVGKAYDELEDAETEAEEEFVKAQKELEDAKKELADGKKELAGAEAEIEQSEQELVDSEAELARSERQLAQGETELAQLKGQLDALEMQIALLQQYIADGMDAAAISQAMASMGVEVGSTGDINIETMEQQLVTGRAQLEAGTAALEENRTRLATGRAQLEDGKRQLEDAKETIAKNKRELEDGENEISENEKKLANERQKAAKKFEDAREEIQKIELAQWYIQDRSVLSGYTNIQSDSDCIEAVGTAFPILFFAVAILISLTTITRMVEEERGLIGTYKALGLTDKEIRRKYLIYVASACTLGSILGDICGFIVLPAIIFWIFSVMYQLPYYLFDFDYLYGIGGALLFAAGILGATWIACGEELRHMPATLMRPKTPRSGSRIFLERITPLWGRLSFLNKVTARNLFRYKRRLLMTIGGIMGCTALVLCGFVIKDSVLELMPNQYDHVYQFDAMVVSEDTENEILLKELTNMTEVSDFINLRIDSVTVKCGGESLSMQLFVFPKDIDFSKYICLENAAGKSVSLSDEGMFITQNAANILEFSENDTIQLQDMKLVQREVVVNQLVRNYMGNIVYMSQSAYESAFGEYKPNGVLVHLLEAADQRAFTEEAEHIEGVQSTMSIAQMKDEFSISVLIINLVVYIIIIMAAGLALVVLFTLSTTNISERERELATIKVLGFFDKEVHLYVNKETLILTGIGIMLGLPLGKVLGGMLTNVLKLPSIYFAVSIHPMSYVYAAGLSLVFALFVDFLTDRTLDHIDPVEALKSVE